VLPWESPRVRLFLSHRRKSLFYRKRAWSIIAVFPLTAPDCIGSTMSAPLGSTSSQLVLIPPKKIPILQEASALLGSTSSSPCLFFSHLRHFVISSALLGGITTAILRRTLSAPFDGTRLHWKHHECSLGKYLDFACSYPTRENPY